MALPLLSLNDTQREDVFQHQKKYVKALGVLRIKNFSTPYYR
jgi:hypothetical protein